MTESPPSSSGDRSSNQHPVPEFPTIIVVHHKEKRSKCTVEPLRGRADCEFWNYPQCADRHPENYVRLGLGGPILSPADRDSGLLVLDGTWRWAARMEADFADVPVRSLPFWETAYPRTSKLFEDPAAGLATIEAIFIAYQLLGYSTAGLLDQYYWREDFLEKNGDRLRVES